MKLQTYKTDGVNRPQNARYHPVLFTGKERDEETGYNYHGARYYDAGLLTGWLSVDPMADKYPSISPYSYCAGNPMKLVDPDGREFDPASQEHVNAYKAAINDKLNLMDVSCAERDQLNAALKEIAELEKPGQMYHISDVGVSYNSKKGGTYYKSEDNSICIEYDGAVANLAHELKHAYQFHEELYLSSSLQGTC